MSMATTKANLKELLEDDDIKVIALAGKWGTGKSYMWKEIQAETKNVLLQDALYVSLFGISTIGDLKLRLVQSAVRLGEVRGPVLDAVNAAFRSVKQLATGFFKGTTAIDELALLAVPALVRGKFIVIDDIERKHRNLSVDEILGFIDDFTQHYQCRLLLVLNTDQLTDKKDWDQFREKVIDQELRLDTAPAEAFSIAIKITPSEFSEHIGAAVDKCDVTNIRIIRKIIRTVNRIMADHHPLPSAIPARLIASTVLLSAIYYKGLENGPSMEFILNSQSIELGIEAHERRKQGIDTEEDKQHARWELLMQALDIYGADEFEVLVANYLKSGLFERSRLDKLLDRYLTDARFSEAKARAYAFIQDCIFEPNLNDGQLIKIAQSLLPEVIFLDPHEMTSLHHFVIELDGGEPLGCQMISAWTDHLQEQATAAGSDLQQFILDDPFDRKIHPDIVAAYDKLHINPKKTRSLLDVCLWLSTRNGWKTDDEYVLKSATVEDYLRTILSISGEPLKTFMLKNIDMLKNKSTQSSHFGSAPDRFLEACNHINKNPPNPRWAKLIDTLFKNTGISELLEMNTKI